MSHGAGVYDVQVRRLEGADDLVTVGDHLTGQVFDLGLVELAAQVGQADAHGAYCKGRNTLATADRPRTLRWLPVDELAWQLQTELAG